SDPVLAISRVQNKHRIGILVGQIGEKLIALEERSIGVEILHVAEGVERLIAHKQAVAIGKIGEHTTCEAPFIKMYAADAVGLQIMMYGCRATLIKPDLKHLHWQPLRT